MKILKHLFIIDSSTGNPTVTSIDFILTQTDASDGGRVPLTANEVRENSKYFDELRRQSNEIINVNYDCIDKVKGVEYSKTISLKRYNADEDFETPFYY